MIRPFCLLSGLSLFLLCPGLVFSQSLICREPGIAGYDSNSLRAHSFLPLNTAEIPQVSLYVENTPEGLYVHSNYVTPPFHNPTKILTKDSSDLRRLFVNVLFAGKANPDERENALEAYREQVHLYLDRSLFTEAGYPKVDVGEARWVSVVNGETGTVDVGPIDRLNRTSPPPVLMSRVLGCCLFGIPPHLALQ